MRGSTVSNISHSLLIIYMNLQIITYLYQFVNDCNQASLHLASRTTLSTGCIMCGVSRTSQTSTSSQIIVRRSLERTSWKTSCPLMSVGGQTR